MQTLRGPTYLTAPDVSSLAILAVVVACLLRRQVFISCTMSFVMPGRNTLLLFLVFRGQDWNYGNAPTFRWQVDLHHIIPNDGPAQSVVFEVSLARGRNAKTLQKVTT